ncbi:hypothetical protein [Massilia aerilata]|uniref:TonB-dependent receptor n=1 Tax=Massilia aerilata TaxID=453817 RepID=A0ABW0RQC3_9BURK
MHPAHRLASCAALLFAAAAPLAHAADSGAALHIAGTQATQNARVNASWYQEPGARLPGLSTRLEGGWRLALNLGRSGSSSARADGRPFAAGGRRAMVLSLTRRF